MKLATLRNGRPDGHLVVVSSDLGRYASAGRIAPTLQAALDEWDRAEPELRHLADELNAGNITGQPFGPENALAPLPRAYQWIDGAGYMGHLERVRSLKGSKDTELQSARPLLYQGASDQMSGAGDPIVVPADDLALDYEAEIAAIIGPVPMRPRKDRATAAIRLLTVCNDVSLRRLVARDLEDGFGFFHAKPATAFAPVVATPDELGDLWRNNRLHARVRILVNDSLYGQPDAGLDVRFDLADLIVSAAETRRLGAGTIIGGGTIANQHDEVLPIGRNGIGFACIAEARTAEKVKSGKAETPFLKAGDRVRIAALDTEGRPLFGEIDQTVQLLAL